MKKSLESVADVQPVRLDGSSPFEHVVDYLYDEWTVRVALVIFVLYVAPFGDWRAYIIVPLTCGLLPMLAAELLLFCHRCGLLQWLWETTRDFLNGVWFQLLMGIDMLRQSKPGQFFIGLALCNLSLLAYGIYVNIDVLRVARSLLGMVYALCTSLTDPVAVLASFQELLRNLSVFAGMEHVRNSYVAQAIVHMNRGDVVSFFAIAVVTVALCVVSFVCYFVANFIMPKPQSWLGMNRPFLSVEKK